MAATQSDAPTHTDDLVIAGRPLRSRLLLGTGGFPSLKLMAAAIEASGSELVTVALRRLSPPRPGEDLAPRVADRCPCRRRSAAAAEHRRLLTARDAVPTRSFRREAFATD
jgi:thiazole synthase